MIQVAVLNIKKEVITCVHQAYLNTHMQVIDKFEAHVKTSHCMHVYVKL